MSLRQAALQAILLCRWIDETPHQRGSINGMAAQARHALEQALAEPEQPYDQTALDLCKVCGWRTLIPGDACLNCERSKQPEQEPVAWMSEGGDVSRSKRYMDEMGFKCEPLYTAPTPQREHITDGSPCWCNPDVIEEAGGNVIVHNYEDNWQQYAKPGETAQQCIERHRGEQDALMKLYAIPLRPLTDEQCDSILLALDEWAKRFDHYDYGLPLYNEELRVKAREVMRIAHGITGEQT